jgi:hypothetical protein
MCGVSSATVDTTTDTSVKPGSKHIVAGTASDADTQRQIADEVRSVLASEPTEPPDASDAKTHLAAEAHARSVLAQRGRSSTFKSGLDLTGSGPQAVKSILGG